MGGWKKHESDRTSQNSICCRLKTQINIYNLQRELPLKKLSLRSASKEILSFLKISCEEISIFLVSEKKIKVLHAQFFDDPSPTDCISFPIDDLYRNDLKNREYAKEAPRFLAKLADTGPPKNASFFGQAVAAKLKKFSARAPKDASSLGWGAGETKSGGCPTPAETGSSGCFSIYLGEIFICPAMAIASAKKRKLDPYEEVLLYLIHGILHLSGYDDLRPTERKIMRKMEKLCMAHLRRKKISLL